MEHPVDIFKAHVTVFDRRLSIHATFWSFLYLPPNRNGVIEEREDDGPVLWAVEVPQDGGGDRGEAGLAEPHQRSHRGEGVILLKSVMKDITTRFH